MRSHVPVLLIALLSTLPIEAQWLHHRDPKLPRTANGAPDLEAAAPVLANGTPDFSGLWAPLPDRTLTGGGGVEDGQPPRYFLSIAGGATPGSLPMQPWAASLFAERRARLGRDQPTTWCQPLSTPARPAYPLPMKIMQTPELIVMLYEYDSTYRQVFLDGRAFPNDPQPSYLGYSVGRFENGDLVIESIGFRDEGWLDAFGHPHSRELRLTERYRRVSMGRMDVTVTIHDPKAYTEDVRYTQPLGLLPDSDLMEYFCQENEKDQPHLVKPGSK